MNRIARLRELEHLADKPVKQASAERWEAAHIYWIEVEAGRSKRNLALEIGKSAQHVVFMFRCWDIVVARSGIEGVDYASLPSFGQVYNSDEVRGRDSGEQTERASGSQGSRRREPRYREPDNLQSQAMRMARLADLMNGSPKPWTEELDEAGQKAMRRCLRIIQLNLPERSPSRARRTS